jgi:peroxiredoxin
MKHLSLYISFVFIILNFSFIHPRQKIPVEVPQKILHSFNTFWDYWNRNVKLSANYIVYDEKDSLISKEIFLKELSSGKYLPLRLKSNDLLCYQLYPLRNIKDPSIANTIGYYAGMQYLYLQMKGKPLTGFNFTDLKGNRYNATTCRGKIVVLNCWFINCPSCIEEIPELNQLVKTYQNRREIVFVGLAFDSPGKLKEFLKTTTFHFAIVPDKEKYLIDTLKFPAYPTDVIINRQGLVAEVMNGYNELEIALKKQVAR